jgi:tetratricopeptide (TPR) repeat protein
MGDRDVSLIRVALSGLLLPLALLVVDRPAARAQDSAQQLTANALQECDLGRRAAERSARLAHFERGEKLAEQAIAQNNQLADAHFALFCSAGEQLRIDGETMSSLWGFRRVMRALDRTLELDPNHLDALSSKGTFLVRLPVMMGGDVEKGEQMLRQVIQRDSKAVNARIALAKTYASRGRQQEALSLANEALTSAQAQQRADLIPECQATVSAILGIRAGNLGATP